MKRIRGGCQLVHMRTSAMFVSTVTLPCPNTHAYKFWFERLLFLVKLTDENCVNIYLPALFRYTHILIVTLIPDYSP